MTGPEAFARTWRALGCTGDPAALHAELVLAWREPHRAYHVLAHLEHCLRTLDELVRSGATVERRAEVEAALWFHDAIYDPTARDSEERSAAWAEAALIEGGAGVEVAARVKGLVLATRHGAVPSSGDAALLCDADLAILGSEPALFDRYEEDVRREYAFVPDDAFRAGRARILRSFLDRPSIYTTATAGERFEAAARSNLARSLARLGAAP